MINIANSVITTNSNSVKTGLARYSANFDMGVKTSLLC